MTQREGTFTSADCTRLVLAHLTHAGQVGGLFDLFHRRHRQRLVAALGQRRVQVQVQVQVRVRLVCLFDRTETASA